ncbi:hypothetical protein METHPM2_110049 [Pseudomonas sp. PM2]
MPGAEILGIPPIKVLHSSDGWVGRLTLAPAVEFVDRSLGKLDWLTLPGILQREPEKRG